MNRKKFFIFALAALFFLSGCVPNFGPINTQSDSEFVKGKVPSKLSNLPFYPKARVIEGYGYQDSSGVSLVSNDELSKVVNFYSENLEKLGWETFSRKQSENNYIFDIKNTTDQGYVIVNTASDGKRTAITVAVFPR